MSFITHTNEKFLVLKQPRDYEVRHRGRLRNIFDDTRFFEVHLDMTMLEVSRFAHRFQTMMTDH